MTGRRLFLFAVALAVLTATQQRAAAQAACTASGPDAVCTESGPVRGTVADGVRALKGMPYAQPPVGALRFRPPQPPAPWREERSADKFGPPCPQLGPDRAVVGDEDCLTLNVW